MTAIIKKIMMDKIWLQIEVRHTKVHKERYSNRLIAALW